MPSLLPTAFAECIEEEEREIHAQSIELERQRKQQAEIERRIAEVDELERIQQEIEEAERRDRQPPQANAVDITKMMISRMTDLAAESHIETADNELIESLTRSLQQFFDQTTSTDAEYLTRTATEYVDQLRTAEAQRIRKGQPDLRAALITIKHAGKYINCLPNAIQQVLQQVKFNSDAPSREPPEDQAEFEEDPPLDEEIQGVPSRDRQNSSSSAAWQPQDNGHEQGQHWTIEAHVLNDNRLQQCQCHQTDIRTLEQPFPTARSTIWHRRNGSNKVWMTSGLVMQCTRMQQIP